MSENQTVCTFNIIKKDRKYFAATLNGYKCKIVIDDASQSLEIGDNQALKVNDLSVRSKYGTDLIFSLAVEASQQKSTGICTLRHDRYNKYLVEKCRALGGKWDGAEKAWIFSSIVEAEVDALDDLFNSEKAVYEIEFTNPEDCLQDAITVRGYSVAHATGRDSGAKTGDGVAVLAGGFSSGGSRANWTTTVQGGTKIRMELPVSVIKHFKDEDEGYRAEGNRVITEIKKTKD